MWAQGRKEVEEVFFKDKIELYEQTYTEDELGENIPSEISLGEFQCNIQNGTSSVKDGVSSQAVPQLLRVSLPKGTPLQYEKIYSLKILEARLFHTGEIWKVDGFVEAHLSTVLTASRGVRI